MHPVHNRLLEGGSRATGSPACAADFNMEKRNQAERASSATSPAYGIEALLQIAKDKMNELSKDGGHSGGRQHGLNDATRTSASSAAPPCALSSFHTLNAAGTGACKLAQRQKSYTKRVHFADGPPKVINRSLGEPFELDQQHVFGELSKRAQSKSKGRVILNENGGPTDSVRSSVGSMESASSLRKGNGNGSRWEEVAEPGTSYHHQRRETGEGDHAAADSFFNEAHKETVRLFKMQNPVATRRIGEEVDLLLTECLERLSSLRSPSKPQKDGPGIVGEMSTTFENEFNADRSVIYEVPEDDETLDLDLDDKSPPPYESVSEASTLIESVPVQHIPSDNATQRKSESERQAKSFPILTLHFPQTATATAGSHQEANLVGGGRSYYDEYDDTESESDCPWLPPRAESLTKKIEKAAARARSEAGSSSGSKQDKKGYLKRSKSGASAGPPEDNLDDQGQGCDCAKMCVIM